MVALVQRDPFGSLFDAVLSDFFRGVPASYRNERSAAPAVARARIDVVDKGEKFEVTADLPGVSKQDIQVTVEGARVALEATAKNEREVKDGERVLHTERHATRFARSFELPAEVTEAGAEASFENGVLRLVLPKRDPIVAKRIAIN
jgi:HSP20 family protein